MRALVAYKKKKQKWRYINLPYVRIANKRMATALIARLTKLGYEVKIFNNLGW